MDGKINVKVPPGTQDGDKLTLEKYGVWAFNPPDTYDPVELRGNFILSFKIVIPSSFTAQQVTLLQQFAELESKNREKWYDFAKTE